MKNFTLKWTDARAGILILVGIIFLFSVAMEAQAGYITDKRVDVWRLQYNKKGLGWADLSNSILGAGGGYLRNINRSDKRDTYIAFPDGLVSNPETIVYITTGMQTGDGADSYLTGQQAGYKNFNDDDGKGPKTISGNSLYGRLRYHFGSLSAQYILVLDNAANWGDRDSEDIHHWHAGYVAAKAGTNTRHIILAGRSRGGYMVADMAKYIRRHHLVDDNVAIYVFVQDGVAGGGSAFGVDTNDYENSPLLPDNKAEKTNVYQQIAWPQRKNKTFFFNQISGQEVIFKGVHSFCSRTYEIFANYWVDEWTIYSHNFSPEASDAFMEWFWGMFLTIERGFVQTRFQNGWAANYHSENYLFEVRAGGHLNFHAWWSAKADLDITVYDETGRRIGGGSSWSDSDEQVNIVVPRSGIYRVKVYAFSGAAEFDSFAKVDVDPNTVGRFDLPRERINKHSGYDRYYDIAVSGGSHVINLELEWSDPDADLDLYLLDGSGRVIAYSSDWNTTSEYISTKITSGGHYRIKVQAYDKSGPHNYSLEGIAPLYNSNN